MGDRERPRRVRHRAWSGETRISPPVAAAVAVASAEAVWFAVNFGRPHGPVLLLWLAAPVAPLFPAATGWRAARAAWLPVPTRRFWRAMATSAALVSVADCCQVYEAVVLRLGGQHIGPLSLSVDGLAILVILWAMFRLPLSAAGPGDRLRVGLDAATVMIAAAVFMWHFQTRPLLDKHTGDTVPLLVSGLATVLVLVAVFAVAKVVLVGRTFIDAGSLRLLALTMVIGSLGGIPQRFLVDRPYLVCSQVVTPIAMIFSAMAGDRQWRAARNRAGGRVPTARHPFSMLPYAAVVAVDALLLASTWGGSSSDAGVVALVAVALTGLVVVRQITAFRENVRLLARLDHSATHDALTRLPNRALFADRVRAALAAGGPDRGVSVALIDLDDFKLVNDTLGHGIGDALLVAVARRLADSIRSTDTVARLGGDEFVILLDDIDPSGADRAVEKMIDALATPVDADGYELSVHASIGIADGRTGDDASELLRRADIAMYVAKGEAGSGYVHFTPDVGGVARGPAPLGTDLADTIAEDRLVLVYQPIVALDDERLLRVEALARLSHPDRGLLAPAQFIPAAERTGLIVPLGRRVIREACRQLAAWSATYGDRAPAVVNVNVSARQLREPSFADEVADILAETGIAPHRLTLELTESTAVSLGPAAANLGSLRRLGVRIALDDFGTGQSALTLLQDLPVDELKLDRSFTQARQAPAANSVAAAVIHLARALGLYVVAEGVETPQQADTLRALGYQAAQGYYFARPMPASDLDAVLGATGQLGIAA